jgi:hypothetical protein
LYSSIAYAVVNDDDGLGTGWVSIYESDVNWAAGSGGTSVAGAGEEEAETWRQCLDVHLLKTGKESGSTNYKDCPLTLTSYQILNL